MSWIPKQTQMTFLFGEILSQGLLQDLFFHMDVEIIKIMVKLEYIQGKYSKESVC